MNLLLVMVLGILLTIGTALMTDAFTASDVTVNWDVAKERLHETSSSIAIGWERLKSGVQKL